MRVLKIIIADRNCDKKEIQKQHAEWENENSDLPLSCCEEEFFWDYNTFFLSKEEAEKHCREMFSNKIKGINMSINNKTALSMVDWPGYYFSGAYLFYDKESDSIKWFTYNWYHE